MRRQGRGPWVREQDHLRSAFGGPADELYRVHLIPAIVEGDDKIAPPNIYQRIDPVGQVGTDHMTISPQLTHVLPKHPRQIARKPSTNEMQPQRRVADQA